MKTFNLKIYTDMTFRPRKYNSVLKNENGVSLVEGLLAAAILALGVLGYASLQGNIVNLGQKSAKKSVSITLAQDKLEALKNLASKIELPDTDSLTSPIYSDGTWSNSLGETIDSEGDVDADGDYERTWTIAPDADLGHFYDLSVSVGWQDRSSNPLHTVTLYTQVNQDFRVEAADVEVPENADDSDPSDEDKDKDKDKDSDSGDKDKDKDKDSDSGDKDKDKDKDKDSDSGE